MFEQLHIILDIAETCTDKNLKVFVQEHRNITYLKVLDFKTLEKKVDVMGIGLLGGGYERQSEKGRNREILLSIKS